MSVNETLYIVSYLKKNIVRTAIKKSCFKHYLYSMYITYIFCHYIWWVSNFFSRRVLNVGCKNGDYSVFVEDVIPGFEIRELLHVTLI